MAPAVADPNDPDPIRASYDVYIKPRIQDGRQVYVFQFPNRASTQDYSEANSSKPLELRIKPTSGLVELDVPVDAWRNYDRAKGVNWGEAMRKVGMVKGGGNYGLPGGFGIGGNNAVRGGKKAVEDEAGDRERILADYPAAVTQQRVLVKQTLGGQAVPREPTGPQYMVGTFRKGQLHLTPITNIVQLRPQFHHIDAVADIDRARQSTGAAPPPPAQARAVQMTVKQATDNDEDAEIPMATRIRQAQEEPWRKLRYVDENSGEAWDAFEELFVPNREMLEDEKKVGEGEEKEKEKDEAIDGLAETPKLVSTMDDMQYLDAISAPRDAARLSRSKRGKKGEESGSEASDDEVEEL